MSMSAAGFTCRHCGNWMAGGKNGRHLSCRVTHVLVVVTRMEQEQIPTGRSPEAFLDDWNLSKKNEKMLPWCPHQHWLNYVETLTLKITRWTRWDGEVTAGDSSGWCVVTFHSGWQGQESSKRDRTKRNEATLSLGASCPGPVPPNQRHGGSAGGD